MMNRRHFVALQTAGIVGLASGLGGIMPASAKPTTMGKLVKKADGFVALVSSDAKIEKLAEGFGWSEGPVWVGGKDGYVLFSDVPGNIAWRWSEADGLSEWMNPSGLAGDTTGFREPGSNGLFPGRTKGEILMCDHGNRALMAVDLATKEKTPLATHYNGKKFSSPNDVVLATTGDMYFTDPPYGLEGIDNSPLKEQPHNGVYHRAPDGTITLIDAELTKPNGIGLSPDEKTLYVAVSDPDLPRWWAYDLVAANKVENKRVLFDGKPFLDQGYEGLPDGFAVDKQGNIFASGPGGVLVFNSGGEILGVIETGTKCANCAFGGDGSTLYIASHMYLARVQTLTTGLGF